jgi:hypothetical protein
MVAALYAIILIPIVIYLVFSVLEIWSLIKISRHPGSKAPLYIQATTELTNTILVFAYAQFMITHSSLLTEIGAELYAPVALLIATVVTRAAIYLYVFNAKSVPSIVYPTFIATYLAGVVSLVWGLLIVVPAIITTGYVPDTTNLGPVLTVGPFVLAALVIPSIAIYRDAMKKLR